MPVMLISIHSSPDYPGDAATTQAGTGYFKESDPRPLLTSVQWQHGRQDAGGGKRCSEFDDGRFHQVMDHLLLDNAALHCNDNSVGTITCLQFRQDALDMPFNGMHRKPQIIRDDLV